MIKITNLDTNTSIEVVPSSMQWSLQDVSAADSGRDVNGYMYKNRVTKKRKLEFEFNGIEWSEAPAILKAVDSEYFTIEYPDMLSGTMETRTFYRGDIETPVWCWWTDKKILSKVSFNAIER